MVPKNLYRLDLEGPSGEHEHSLYNSISLGRGQIHHVAINTNDPGAVLTWDFDVMRYNVIFTVLHQTKDDLVLDSASDGKFYDIICRVFIL